MTNVVAATAWTHQIDEFAEIPGTGKTISSILNCKLYRKATDAGADLYGQPASVLGFDIHYQIDGFGSDKELTKAPY